MVIHVPTLRPIQACRDAKEDKFLTLAVNRRADALITGDEDLLRLHPFLDISILTPTTFLTYPLDPRTS
ncbi:MAG: putative toxin-antitoxin system toxin component, PIN family [Candidatus Methylacidiphilales bacterium]|nr:putative toxin-antitoxin system toxin component, PIN family [Candidatus Methylacidiphilales bacterium]